MHSSIVDELFNIYKEKGFVTEDIVFDTLVAHNLSLDEVDATCETLLLKGIIIRNDALSQDEDDNFYDRSQIDYEAVFSEVVVIDKTMSPFIEEIRQIRPPQAREWQNLIVQAQNGNDFARERIITMYLRVVVRIALWHYKKYNIDISDAIQNGSQGLVIALDKFEIGRQDNFSTYAPWWIRQYIMREAQAVNSLIYYPAHYKEKIFGAYEVCAVHDCELRQDDYNCPTLSHNVSEKLSCDESEAKDLIDALIPMDSIEGHLEDNECCFSDRGFISEEMFDDLASNELSQLIQDELSKLSQREKEVISMRYGLLTGNTCTLEELGQVYGVTRERIRQIEAKAIRKLRHSSRLKKIEALW